VAGLRQAGVQSLVMLTGDNKRTAAAIGQQVGVDEVQAELLPADKVAAINRLADKYSHVAMVGDGVNDAPALAAATVGIALGVAGTDTAIETADIALMADDLTKLPWLMRLSSRTVGIIGQNIALSLLIKGVVLILTFMGRAELWMGVLADTGAALLVIANGMRLMRSK
ncbi:MAG: HAD-IC family P-type ATPase, partial [Firmicutes bacterium]|nr:HAD-IC family P-type ATPase [Bacillota bacterium]